MQRGKVSLGSLVAMAAIFVVMAVVRYPCFVRTDYSPKVECLNNLHACAAALKHYEEDYNGQMPSSYLVSHSSRWNEHDAFTFCTMLGPMPPRAAKHTWAAILYD